jgi:hypothetical protein
MESISPFNSDLLAAISYGGCAPTGREKCNLCWKARAACHHTRFPPLPVGLDGVIDALLSAQHVLEMFRRALPDTASRTSLARLSNRLTKILAEARKLTTP